MMLELAYTRTRFEKLPFDRAAARELDLRSGSFGQRTGDHDLPSETRSISTPEDPGTDLGQPSLRVITTTA
jgi:hypothetical protein